MLLQTTCYFNRINKQHFYNLPPFFVGLLLNIFILSNSFAQASQHESFLFLGNKNIAPVVYLDNGLPSGVVVDIVHALEKHMSQPIAIMAMDWSEAQALVARGEADALMQINSTEERTKIYDFSDTLLESQFSIFTTTNRVGISGISSLGGLQVGVESGGLPQLVLKNDPLVKLVVIPNFLEGFKLLNEASLDAVVVDYRVGSYALAENKIQNIKVTGKPIASSFSSIAVKKGNSKLLAEINTALRIIKADGTYQNVLDNWKPKESYFYSREQITNVIIYAALLSLLILLLIAVLWIVTLKKEFTQKKAAEESLYRLNRELRAISDCNQTLIRAEDEQTLLNDICHIICAKAGYRMAWVGYAEFDDAKTVRSVAWAGHEEGYLTNANITWADTERGRGPTGTAIRSGNTACVQDFSTEPQAAPWRESALQRCYRSNIALPLKDESTKTFGALTLYSTEPNTFTTDEIHLLEELAGDLAFGIMVLRTRIEHRRTEKELNRLNVELEQRVKERTDELEQKIAALDRMNRLFVGRELRMKELKEKIARLEGKNISE